LTNWGGIQGHKPINSTNFLDKFRLKYKKWDNFQLAPLDPVTRRLSKLEATWNINCRALNNVILENQEKASAGKYIISAPTGSAKTETLITYCSMLPKDVKALISTNLTDEADNIAKKINDESDNIRAYSYHSKKDEEDRLKIDNVAKFQIIVTTHSFYQNNYTGTEKWLKLAEDRDLIVIDEALETMKEYSVKDDSLKRAIMILEGIQKSNKFRLNTTFANELQLLRDELNILKDYKGGTKLINTDKTTSNGIAYTLSNSVNKYQLFSELFGISTTTDKTLNKYLQSIKFSYLLTGMDNETTNERYKREIKETISNLNLMNKLGQVYITSNQGHNSFHRVTDMPFKKSLVCFDATADVNQIYSLRKKYYKDIHLFPQKKGVRNYSNVVMYSTIGRTSKDDIDSVKASDILKSVKLGEKTLIITHKSNKSYFKQEAIVNYSNKIIDVAHWNAITGLNNWQDFDTCIIAGLNHKPRNFSQNRVTMNTDSEETAFGDEQEMLNDMIESSVILTEIIQAMNRIRIRKIINTEGGCKSANIYIILPQRQEAVYKKQISGQMPNIQLKEWQLQTTTNKQESPASFTMLVEFLDGNLKKGELILKKEIITKSGVNKDTFRTMMGKSKIQKQAFLSKLNQCGYGIKEEIPVGKRRPLQYFYKV